MSEQTKLGQLVNADQGRDAVHVAVAPVVAAERLSPGQHIGFIGERVGNTRNAIGIVDPFLKGPVFEGERFFIFLYPNTITSLRHEWEHDSFPKLEAAGAKARTPSEEWLREFAAITGGGQYSYHQVMAAAKDWLENEEYLCFFGSEPHLPEEFWDHYETVTGARVPEDKRRDFFSCSC